MRLLRRRGEGLSQDWTPGSAVVRESKPYETTGGGPVGGGDVAPADFGLGSLRYRFRLEITDASGRDPYEVDGLFDVPAKVELVRRLPPVERERVPVGITLPVRVDPADEKKVAIDWNDFLASGGHDEMRRLALSSEREEAQRAHPEQFKQLQAGASPALEAWVQAVRRGNLSRAEFEESVANGVEQGWIDGADAEAARRSLG